ncbi:MAG: ribonuclease [Gammaproteobacteria bacterium]|nr:ribonuclease [Gammaproteobacteria bacterium]MBU1645926.1 ribonuclease [Gammaproteobacteria bacterium]MBU1971988.1 ribonuclease [Gammaproteobacteria bacterium]
MLRLLAALLLCGLFGSGSTAWAQEISRADLPPEGRETLKLIRQGGPFPHKRDGIVFNNFEKRLPLRPRGHYREYTVATPGVRHRGARRIVCGGERQHDCHYSADHYRSFRKIRE